MSPKTNNTVILTEPAQQQLQLQLDSYTSYSECVPDDETTSTTTIRFQRSRTFELVESSIELINGFLELETPDPSSSSKTGSPSSSSAAATSQPQTTTTTPYTYMIEDSSSSVPEEIPSPCNCALDDFHFSQRHLSMLFCGIDEVIDCDDTFIAEYQDDPNKTIEHIWWFFCSLKHVIFTDLRGVVSHCWLSLWRFVAACELTCSGRQISLESFNIDIYPLDS